MKSNPDDADSPTFGQRLRQGKLPVGEIHVRSTDASNQGAFILQIPPHLKGPTMRTCFVLACLLILATAAAAEESPVLLTPPPGPAPKINGPKVYACGPKHPFLYRIPATGRRPMQFAAEGLPAGLALDAGAGIIRGAIAEKGEYRVTLRAKNEQGQSERPLKIVCGDTLALTPPMGWNSWYIHYNRVTEVHLREAAKQMIASGMADYGYQYVDIDACWAKKQGEKPYRDAQGAVLPGPKFSNIKGMVDEIHAAGLKAGIYTSPGPWECCGCTGAYQHEGADVKKFAEWGFDFLKYDWCGQSDLMKPKGPNKWDLANMKKPYQLIAAVLKKQDRDIVLNLCQYGMGDVWKWGGEVGQCWRTTGDLGATPGKGGLPGFYVIGFSNAEHWKYAKPGCWNDPDYVLIGYVGDANSMGVGRKTTLTPDEQYSYMSMWCLMAAPLFFGGDMARLDPLTLNVLCNAEAIDVDQDPLGRQARIIRKTPSEFILLKDLEDGSKALGLFNLGEAEATISATWKDLGLSGKQQVRDLWRQKDLPPADEKFAAKVPRHGVLLVKLRPEGGEPTKK
jgi:alpha-galactosidase